MTRRVLLLTGLGAVTLQAEELPETVVTAGRTPEKWSELLYSTDTITNEEFVEQGFRTIPESLLYTPGVSVQKTTHGHGSPFIRGFTGRQNLFLVDGIRINNSTWRSGPVQYLNTIDGFGSQRLELVKSQGSVLYGSDALGGTLNVFSGATGFQGESGRFFGGRTLYRFDTNSESHVGRVETRFGEGGKWGVILGGSLKDFGNLRDSGIGTFKKTGYDEENLDIKLEAMVTPDILVTLAHQYVNQDDVWRWHSTVFNDEPWNGTSTGTFDARIYDQERSLTYLRAQGEPMSEYIDRWSATFSYQKSQDSQIQDRSPTDFRTSVIDVDTYGFDVQGESTVGNGQIVYGFDYYRDEIDSKGSRTGRDPRSQRPVADDSTYDLLGVFGQYRWNVSERADVAIGARYTHADVELGKLWDPETETDVSASDDWDEFTFSLRGNYEICRGWNLFGGASQGFRAPNVTDLSGNITSLSGSQEFGSLDLDPETTWTFELGSRVSQDRWSGQISGFYTLVDDVITRVPESETNDDLITTNGLEADIYGIEIEGEYALTPELLLSGFLTWQEGRADIPEFIGGPIDEQWVSRLSPLRGGIALRYQPVDGNWWVEGRVTAADEQDKLSETDKGDTQRIPPGGTPSYIVASINSGWQVHENVLLTLGLDNITDEDYRIHGSGVNGPGFGAIFGVQVEW